MSCTLERGQPRPTPPIRSIYDPPRPKTIPDPGMLLRTPYDDYFVVELKRLPAADREWTGEVWWIHARHEARVVELVVAFFGGLTIVSPGDTADVVVDRNGRSVQERLL